MKVKKISPLKKRLHDLFILEYLERKAISFQFHLKNQKFPKQNFLTLLESLLSFIPLELKKKIYLYFLIYTNLSDTLKHSATSDMYYTQTGEIS